MASTTTPLQKMFDMNSSLVKQPIAASRTALCLCRSTTFLGSKFSSLNTGGASKNTKKWRSLTVVAAVGDVSSEGTTYLIAGAAAVALTGTAFPIFFSRKDLCPECDGAGFIRQAGATLRATAARKDQTQIVCPRGNGLGKLNQVDK